MKRIAALLMLVGMSLLSGAAFADANNSNTSNVLSLGGGCTPGETC